MGDTVSESAMWISDMHMPIVSIRMFSYAPSRTGIGKARRLHLPLDHATGGHRKFAFAEYTLPASARYAAQWYRGGREG